MTELSTSPEKQKRSFELIPPSSEVLNTVSEEIEPNNITSKEVQSLIDGMLDVANGEQGDTKRRTMVGLAAPQLGVAKRIIIIDTASTGMGETPELQAFINPKIVSKSEATEQGREGCFSTGNVCGNVDRYSEIVVEAFDRWGEPVSATWTGFTARIFQHEIDHLDGIRFPDRITDETKLHWVEPDKFGEYRTKWAEWEELCPQDRWEAIKSGVAP